MKIELFLVCEAAVVDRRTNNLSVINILNELTPTGFPLALSKVVLVAEFNREGKEKAPRVVVRIKQGDAILLTESFTPDFQGRHRTRHLMEIHGLVLSQPLPVVFQLLRDSRQIAKHALAVNPVPGSQPVRES